MVKKASHNTARHTSNQLLEEYGVKKEKPKRKKAPSKERAESLFPKAAAHFNKMLFEESS